MRPSGELFALVVVLAAPIAIAVALLTAGEADPPGDPDVEAGRLVRLTRTWDTERDPAWSPKGEKIAFECYEDHRLQSDGLGFMQFGSIALPGPSEICVMNVDGSGREQLDTVIADNADPAWSPDGNGLVFSSTSGAKNGIHIVNGNGSGLERIAFSGHHPVLSPDGSTIAFSSKRGELWDIHVMNADGSSPSRVPGARGRDGEPTWSPDGTQIAFVSDSDEGSGILVVNLDGTDGSLIPGTTGSARSPAWSPDGERIAFASDVWEDGVQNREIFVVNVDGTGLTRLTNRPNRDSDPAWSPDGRRLVFSSDLTGNSEIYVMEFNR